MTLHLHGGSPKPGTDSNEIHTKQVIMGYFRQFSKLLLGLLEILSTPPGWFPVDSSHIQAILHLHDQRAR